jgi:hypothetical protein
MKRLYHAFLLRIWQAGSPENPAWRASLEDPHTRQVLNFPDLAALNDYLSGLKFLSESTDANQGLFAPVKED